MLRRSEVNEVKVKGMHESAAGLGRRLKRILIADDNEGTRRELARQLAGVEGLVVDQVGNGRDAISAAEDNKPDAIVMDMRMPVMDGYKAMRAIRTSRNGLKKVPIIALTEAYMSGEIERCIRAGASDYVARPFTDNDTLRAKVLFWSTLGRDEFAASAPATSATPRRRNSPPSRSR
ncbi:MAG: response regulator [Myxococcales bacterium]|nr:MAG: response regulator [Myxococcales bacterium]